MTVVSKALEERKQDLGDSFNAFCRFLILDTIDRRWKDHLYGMDHLRAAIGLEGYGQKDPKMRYKEEAFKLFVQMQGLVRQDLTKLFFRVQIQIADPAAEAAAMPAPGPQGSLAAGGFKPAPTPPRQVRRHLCLHLHRRLPAAVATAEIGPDDPCPCGSGRPYGQCHGVF